MGCKRKKGEADSDEVHVQWQFTGRGGGKEEKAYPIELLEPGVDRSEISLPDFDMSPKD